MPEVTLSAGTIHYEKSGPPTGRPVVFIHGYAMASSLWRPLSERLAEQGYACYAPTWPLGAHTEPMVDRAKVTMEGIAGIVAEFLERLELTDVVLVGNDTGGAIAQIVATTAPARLGALVLTSCDAFEHFPPKGFAPLIAAAKFGPTFRAALAPLKTKRVRQRGYGMLAHTDIDQLVQEWVKPALTDSRIREDLRHFTGSLHRETMVEAGVRLPRFTKPTLIAWSADDTFFPSEDAPRLAEALPESRLKMVKGARTFSMIDQPDVLAELIAEFAWEAAVGHAA
jgi:pimeloyl-ACP methyl ester carboxylesterase